MIHLKSDSIRNVPISYVLPPPMNSCIMNSACNSNCNLHLLVFLVVGAFRGVSLRMEKPFFFSPKVRFLR